jgi:outer membrane autotransporter protein
VTTYRPEAALYAALPSQLRQGSLAMLGDLHKRMGDEDVKAAPGQDGAGDTAGAGRRAWGRLMASDIDVRQGGTVSPTSHGGWTGFQAGTDLLSAPRWRAGVYVGQLDGDARVNGFASGVQNLPVGRNDLRSRYLGAYGTYTADNGFYADGVLQAGRHRYTVAPLGLAGTESKGDSLSASLEIGRPFALGASGWAVEPQLQWIHQRLDLDDAAIPGALVQPRADSGWTARLGVRLKGAIETAGGLLQLYGRINVYRASGGTDTARFVNGPFATGIGAPIGRTSAELAGGFTLGVGKSSSLYGEVGRVWATGGDARVEASVNGSVGLRLKW